MDQDGKKRLLAAVIPKAEKLITSIVENDRISTTFVHEIDQAIALLLSEDYDLLICSVHFDDSRGLELLQRTKGLARNAHTPFLVLRTDPKPLGVGFSGSINLAVRELGGIEYVDISNSALPI